MNINQGLIAIAVGLGAVLNTATAKPFVKKDISLEAIVGFQKIAVLGETFENLMSVSQDGPPWARTQHHLKNSKLTFRCETPEGTSPTSVGKGFDCAYCSGVSGRDGDISGRLVTLEFYRKTASDSCKLG